MQTSWLVLLNIFVRHLSADVSYGDIRWHMGIPSSLYDGQNKFSYEPECGEALEEFAHSASDLSFCFIQNSRPIRLCEKCIKEYVKFYDKYQELLTKVVNGTSCQSIFISQDRLNVVVDLHDNIAAVWHKGHCDTCYDWNGNIPTLKKHTVIFNKMYNDTMICIHNNITPGNQSNVCEKCLDSYVQLDTFYKTLSADAIGVDSICMDIVDSMNSTRSIWSKKLDCCNLRRTPEITFLCCSSIISILPVIYYLAVRFCGPIRALPSVLKQSRFKQTILRGVDAINE